MVLQFVGAPIAIGGSRLSFRKSSSIMTGIFCLLWNHYCLFDKFSAPHPLSRWKRLRFLWNDRKRVEILPEWQTERIFTSFVTLEASHTKLLHQFRYNVSPHRLSRWKRLTQNFSTSFAQLLSTPFVTLEASHTKLFQPVLLQRFTASFVTLEASHTKHLRTNFTTPFHRIVCHAGSVSHNTFPPSFTTTFHQQRLSRWKRLTQINFPTSFTTTFHRIVCHAGSVSNFYEKTNEAEW